MSESSSLDQPFVRMARATNQTQKYGIIICITALLMFAVQDLLTKILVKDYEVAQLVMIRFWIFAVFSTLIALSCIGWRRALFARRPGLQIGRSALLILEIAIFAMGLAYLGLAEMHASFATSPLIATAIAPFILSEKVGWRRWAAVFVGFIGALIIIRPGLTVFQPNIFFPLTCAFMFALYYILTRLGSRNDHAMTSIFYLGWVGVVLTTPFGFLAWKTPDTEGWFLLMGLGFAGLVGHMLLVFALERTPASTLQPLNYLLLVWATCLGYLAFGELPDFATVTGATVIIMSGLYVMLRAPAVKS